MMRHDGRFLLNLCVGSIGVPSSYSEIVILEKMTRKLHIALVNSQLTSVKLTGTFFPTMLPTVDALARMRASCSLASFWCFSFFAFSSVLFATRSSAGCLA